MKTVLRMTTVVGLLLGATTIANAEKLKELVVYTPPVGVGVLAVDAVENGALDKFADKVTVKAWNSPDKLRAGIMDGSIDITFVPSYAGANLYNKGIKFKLVNIVTGGLLNIISTDTTIKSIEDLKGKTIVVPFKNDMPDLVLRTLFKKSGLTIGKDVNVEYVATPTVAVKMALAGKAKTILLPEIAGTKVSLVAKKKKGIEFKFAVDIQKEWGRLMGGKPYIPQAGIAVRETFLEKNPELVRALHDALSSSADRLQSDKKLLMKRTEKLWPKSGPIFAKSISRWNLDVKTSMAVKPELEKFYSELKNLNPKIIGGKLPDNSFYYK